MVVSWFGTWKWMNCSPVFVYLSILNWFLYTDLKCLFSFFLVKLHCSLELEDSLDSVFMSSHGHPCRPGMALLFEVLPALRGVSPLSVPTALPIPHWTDPSWCMTLKHDKHAGETALSPPINITTHRCGIALSNTWQCDICLVPGVSRDSLFGSNLEGGRELKLDGCLACLHCALRRGSAEAGA